MQDRRQGDRSADGGGSWSDIGQGLPDIPCSAVIVDPQTGRRVERIRVPASSRQDVLLDAIDEDTWAFQGLMEASRSGDSEAIRRSTLHAAEVPLEVATTLATG